MKSVEYPNGNYAYYRYDGLPGVWNRAVFYMIMLLIPVVMLGPVAVRQWSRIKGGIDPLASSDLKLWHRVLCLLLAYIFLVGPEAFHRLAQAETQYSQLSTLAWGKGNTIIEHGYDANGSLTSKTTTEGTTTVEQVEYEYTLQNRLAKVTTTPYVDGQAQSSTLTEYRYNPQGIRVAKVEQIGGTTIQTDYLIDSYNPTGYAQVLEETEYDTSGSTAIPTSRIQYTLGDDVLSQTKSTWTGSAWTANPTQYLLYDGHGSVRQDADAAGNVGQPYHYDGYGNAEGFTPVDGLYYTGEMYDADLGQYYLRARYSNPANGLFNRVDPFAGNHSDPQSLHKYLYCKSNPVNFIDPSGESYISPSVWRLIQAMEPEQALKILIGIRVTYVLGNAYIKEEDREKGAVDINLQIARMSEFDPTQGIEWNDLFKMRPDISDQGRGDVYEVRPDNPAAITKGHADVIKYMGMLHQRHPGKTFFPGAWRPQKPAYLVESLPGIHGMKPLMVTARNAGGGVIAYRVNDNDLGDRVLEILDILRMAGLASVAIQANQSVTAAQAMNVAEIAMRRALMIPTTETVRLKEHVSIATMNTTIGAGAP